jgi:hypothetical protein
MMSIIALRALAAGAVAIAAVACSSAAPAPTSTTVATAAPTAVPTAIATAAATLAPLPTVVPGLSWKYTRDFVAKGFTDKFATVFIQGGTTGTPEKDPTWVDSARGTFGNLAPVFISIRGAAAGGDSNVVAVVVQVTLLSATADPETLFALNTMSDANLASAAVDWLTAEFTKANADKTIEVRDKMTFGSAKLTFQANLDYGGGLRSGSGLRIEPAL